MLNLMEVWENLSEKDIEAKAEYYTYNFSLYRLNTTIDQKFVLISLLCFLTSKAQEKNPKVSTKHVIKKITGQDLTTLQDGLAIMCDDFILGAPQNYPTFGLKSSKEMVECIKEILNKELPFYPENTKFKAPY